MDTQTTTGLTPPSKTKFDLVKEAQAEIQTELTNVRIMIIEALFKFNSIGGQDNVADSLAGVVQRFPDGIPWPYLQCVFPDAALTAARDVLKKAGTIEQVGKKGKITIKPVITA